MKKKFIHKLLTMILVLFLSVLPFENASLQSITSLFFQGASISNSQVVYAATNISLPANTKDGTILHAFDWSFNSIKSKLPDIAAAGYKSIQVSPVQASKDPNPISSTWWNLYQPTNFSIGNALGNKDDFSGLCTEARKYGIGIIVDVVMNHMANNSKAKDDGQDVYPWTGLDSIYKDSTIWHAYSNAKEINYAYRGSVVFDCMQLPDLNTSNSTVQQWELGLLNQCADAGASGFRFDAAKHIATNLGQDAGQIWASNYWDVVLGSGLHNKDNLFVYGEVLQDTTNNTDNSAGYQKIMSVSASTYSDKVRDSVTSCDATKANIADYSGVTPGKAVDYIETHDYYENGVTSGLKDWQRKMGWAIVAARAGSTPLFFARPNSTFGAASNDIWNSSEIIAANQFHNAMAGQNEYLRTPTNQILQVDRGTVGTAIINLGGDANLSLKTNLVDGTYTDQGSSGITLTVSGGTITGNIPGGKALYLYKAPGLTASASVKGGTYSSAQSVALTASTSTASIYYTTDGTTPTASSTKYASAISISSNTTLKFFAVDGSTQSSIYTEAYTFTDPNAAVKVHYKNPSNWGEPNIYYYDVSGVNKGPAWSGSKMTNEGNGWYSYTIQGWSTAKVVFNDGKNQNPGVNQPGFDVTGEKWYEGSTWYNSNPDAPAITIATSPKGGTYTSVQMVSLTASVSNASIYYTIDGTVPTTASTKYTSPITVNTNTTLKSIAVDTLGNQSAVDTEQYTINIPVTITASASPKGGTYTSAQTVSLTASVSNASIYYTIDGTVPTAASTKYTAPITVSSSETLKYIAIDTANNQSQVYSEQYVINITPQYTITITSSINDVPNSSSKNITLTPSAQATIYYTIDGSTPTALSTKYVGTFQVNSGTRLKYFAQDASGNQSQVYTLNINVQQIIIHFKKPSTWTSANLYYYDAAGKLIGPAAPGVAMTSEGNGWYIYTISGWTYATIFFNDGTNQQPASGQAGYDVSGEKWFEDGNIYSSNPDTK